MISCFTNKLFDFLLTIKKKRYICTCKGGNHAY